MKCCDIHSGMLRESVTIQSPTNTRDSVGGFTTVWTDVLATRAQVRGLSGSEQFFAQRLEANASVKVTIRYRSGITEDMRVLIRDEPYQIRYIDNLEFRDRWLVMTCERGVAT